MSAATRRAERRRGEQREQHGARPFASATVGDRGMAADRRDDQRRARRRGRRVREQHGPVAGGEQADEDAERDAGRRRRASR